MFRELAIVESSMKAEGLTPAQRTHVRHEVTKPILTRFRNCIDEHLQTTLPQSPIGQALGYASRHWTELTRFADDGELEIDNNDVERALRHVAVGRKNWLFAGSEAGGHRAAICYSIVMTCKLNGVDPYAYLRDILTERSVNPHRDVAELTPMAWKARSRSAATASHPPSN